MSEASEHDAISVILVFPELIEAFEAWLAERKCHLFRIPLPHTDDGGDQLPTFAVSPFEKPRNP